ncbi:Uncharacterised protein [Legionella busanensis]|uniref:Uncharacterized protein n=1 Tax=Legionella busanensis TaxID=190655 RepID=A0A378JVU6_9GAMM|nr:hypothetical protein [Legionella busanensis]STX52125.1 Uncharacterised protein [Legionella busanensis]STX52332.1 Uncharacterised protein [Legionella busanensis]
MKSLFNSLFNAKHKLKRKTLAIVAQDRKVINPAIDCKKIKNQGKP